MALPARSPTTQWVKKPNSIDIFNLTYEIRWENKEEHLPDDHYGRCSPAVPALVFWMPQSDQHLADSFLHELIHAINRHHGVDADESMTDEEIATRISSGLLTIWKQNPRIFRWWLKLLG